jgi:hypothetical protein
MYANARILFNLAYVECFRFYNEIDYTEIFGSDNSPCRMVKETKLILFLMHLTE